MIGSSAGFKLINQSLLTERGSPQTNMTVGRRAESAPTFTTYRHTKASDSNNVCDVEEGLEPDLRSRAGAKAEITRAPTCGASTRELSCHLAHFRDAQEQIPNEHKQNTSRWDQLYTWLLGEPMAFICTCTRTSPAHVSSLVSVI